MFSQKNEELTSVKKENSELFKKVAELNNEISRIRENRDKERLLYEKKIKEAEIKYRIIRDKNRRIFDSNQDPNKQKPSNLPKHKQSARLS